MADRTNGAGLAGIAIAALAAASGGYQPPPLSSLRDLALPPTPPKKPESPAGTKLGKRLKAGKKLWRV